MTPIDTHADSVLENIYRDFEPTKLRPGERISYLEVDDANGARVMYPILVHRDQGLYRIAMSGLFFSMFALGVFLTARRS